MADVGGDDWGDDDAALTNTLPNAIQVMDAPAAAPRRPASPLGAFGMEDPFAAPLLGNIGFKDVAPAAAESGGGFDDASAPAQNADGFDDWGGDDDFAAPPAAQSANDNFGGSAPANAFNDVATGDVGGDMWDEENVAPNIPAPNVGTKIPWNNADAFLDDMMANANIISPPVAHRSSGFTAVNAPHNGFTSAPPPPVSALAAPAQSLKIDPVIGFNADRLAMLSREDSPPSKSSKKVFRNTGGFSPTPGGQVFRPANAGGVAGSNAIPLAFNRLTGQRAEPKAEPTSAPAVGSGGSDDPFGDSFFGDGGGRSGGDASTPIPGSSDSPRTEVGAGDGGWGDTPPAKPAEGEHVDLDAATGDEWGDGELDY